MPNYTDDDTRKRLLGYLGSEAAASITAEHETTVTKSETPEVDVYLHLLVMIYLLDQNQLEKVGTIAILDQLDDKNDVNVNQGHLLTAVLFLPCEIGYGVVQHHRQDCTGVEQEIVGSVGCQGLLLLCPFL